MELRSKPVVKIDCQQKSLRAVRFNADGQYALTCGSDKTIKLWRPSKLLQLKCYKGHSAEVIDCQSNQDSSQIVSCSNDRSVIAWDVETGKILKRYRNLAPFTSICYGHEARTAFGASVDGTVKIYDLRTLNAWDPIQTLSEASDTVTCCRVAQHFVFTTSLDKGLRIYDIRKGSMQVDTFQIALNYFALSQDLNTILVNCLRGSILMIDRTAGTVLNEFKGNENKLFKIESAFMLNDCSVVAGSEDGNVYLWDVSGTPGQAPRMAFEHKDVEPPFVQTIASDSLDYLLSACGSFLYMWSI